ncbi:MAG: FKBP-type peptidyl-prolyl cis-trans isomerase [Sphingomonadales bacterium]|nr:FKBP-type peptidyl-prolyl cis-trans isomerase [Sphingomonadales bacterium]
MTEITRVPLQPIAKGSLGKLWLGVAAAVLAAGGLAWASLPSGVRVQTVKAGEGASPTMDDVVLVKMKGVLDNGKVFQPEGQGALELSHVIPGFSKAILKMQKGGKYKVEIPPALGYGPQDQRNPQTGQVEIPGGSNLNFDIELIDFKSRAEIEQQQAMIQQMQQAQQAQRGQRGGAEARGLPEGIPEGAQGIPLPR